MAKRRPTSDTGPSARQDQQQPASHPLAREKRRTHVLTAEMAKGAHDPEDPTAEPVETPEDGVDWLAKARATAAPSGRPSDTLTDAALARICESIASGRPVRIAARLHGVSPDTLKSRRKTNAAVDALIEEAQARGADRWTAIHTTLTTTGRRTTGAEFILSRLYPEDFAPPVQRVAADLSTELGARLLAAKAAVPDDGEEETDGGE